MTKPCMEEQQDVLAKTSEGEHMETKTKPSRQDARGSKSNPLKPNQNHMEISNEEKLGRPKYANFMKEIQSKKVKWNEQGMMVFTMALPKKLPTKRENPKRFTISCIIESLYFYNSLYDLGVSVNIMPFSIFRKLGVGELAATTQKLQFSNGYWKHSKGIIEDVLLKVDKFTFPVDCSS